MDSEPRNPFHAPAVRRGLAARLGLESESEQFLHLDALRLIAAAGVVAFHYREWLSWPSSPVPLAALFGFGQFVDLFFVVSGIVITDLYRARMRDAAGYGRFLLKRVARLLPLHWLTLAFFAAVAIASQHLGSGGAGSWSCLWPNLTLTQSFGLCDRLTFNTPSWSISAEMAVYLSFPATLALVARPRWGWAVWVSIVAVLTLFDAAHGGEPWYARTFDGGVVRAVPAFLFGALLASHSTLLARLRGASGLMWLALVLFIALRVADAAPVLRVVLVYLVPLFGLAADRRGTARPVVRALAPWGQLTYSLYMLHLPVAWLCLLIAAKRLGLAGPSMNFAVIATALIVLPAVSIASLRWFEGPMRQAIGSMLSRRPRAANPAVASDFAP